MMTERHDVLCTSPRILTCFKHGGEFETLRNLGANRDGGMAQRGSLLCFFVGKVRLTSVMFMINAFGGTSHGTFYVLARTRGHGILDLYWILGVDEEIVHNALKFTQFPTPKRIRFCICRRLLWMAHCSKSDTIPTAHTFLEAPFAVP